MDKEKIMKIETERKFLVNENWIKPKNGAQYFQGYINTDIHRLVRIRVVEENGTKNGFLTIKGSGNKSGMSRYEFEVEIPVPDAENLLLLCDQPLIEKTRYKIEYEGLIWEVDEFHGLNKGLTIAEIELKNEDQKFSKPDFIDEEITGITKYYNFMLQKNPYTSWNN